jgi:[ribosomal protein S5]-alanine N-acetyltransferase
VAAAERAGAAVVGVVVRGPRFSLRVLAQSDAPALFELGRNPEVSRFFSWKAYTAVDEASAFIASLIRERETGERLELGIFGIEGELVGITGFSEFSRRDRRAVLGTWLGRQFWGSGANRESKALVLALAFRSLGLLRVTALASPQNVRSLAALQRLGFVHEGVLRGWHVHGGVPRDVAVLRMMRDEWERTPLAEVPVELEGDPPPQFVAGPYSQRK